MSAAAGHRPPFVHPEDPHVRVWFDEIAQLYLDAARRLPMADIPYLAECLSHRGLAVGLCDPVTNILLTTIHALALDKEQFHGLRFLHCHGPSKEEALKQTNDKLAFVQAVYRSRLGLIEFMLCYFRYLTYDEAERCLAAAGHNLPLAVSLVEESCGGGSSLGHPDPDSATTKTALERASYMAPPASDDIEVRSSRGGYYQASFVPWQ